MKLVVFLVFLTFIGSVIMVCHTNTVYTIPTFGGNCEYRCHCAGDVQCNSNTGECPNDCENGWMGPACQYRNIAMNKTNVRQHGATYAQDGYGTLAVDGDTATCSKTNATAVGSGEQYWLLQLSRMYYIVGLTIQRPDGDPEKILRVETTNTTAGGTPSFDNPDVHLCAQLNVDQTTLTIEVMCKEPVIANTLRVVQEGSNQPLSLCEVQIYGGRHVSFNEDTTQDSIMTWGDNICYSRRAVDGTGAVETGIKQGLTCSATYDGGGYQRWWQLNLPTTYRIEDVYIFGRIDTTDKISRFNMSIDGTIVYQDTQKPASEYLPLTLGLIVPRDGQVIRVDRLDVLYMCEVLVFSECLPNKCGWDCTEDCMCNSVATGTPRLSATCPYGCTGRWTGTNHKCNTECSATEWGPNCKSTCGHCANNASCDVTTGTCPCGCSPSWKPEMCTEKCDDGLWGVNCSQGCGNCLTNTVCDKENGVCLAGCISGYKPPYCTEECSATEWGPNCKSTCGHCTNNASCDVTSGICPRGCSPSWKPEMCTEKCDEGLWGVNCSQGCGNCLTNTICDKENGVCLAGCISGYKPPYCTEDCDDGSWGYNCSQHCGHCKDGGICDTRNGACPGRCILGYKPPLCVKGCEDGTWGEDCSQECGHCSVDDTCDKVDGVCPGVCLPGYKSPRCLAAMDTSEDLSQKAGDDNNNTLALAVAIPLSVIAICVAVITVIYLRRKMTSPSKQDSGQIPKPVEAVSETDMTSAERDIGTITSAYERLNWQTTENEYVELK